MRCLPLNNMLLVVNRYELSISSQALLIWQPIAPSRFIPDAPSKLLGAARFIKASTSSTGGTRTMAVYIQPTNTTDAHVDHLVSNPPLSTPTRSIPSCRYAHSHNTLRSNPATTLLPCSSSTPIKYIMTRNSSTHLSFSFKRPPSILAPRQRLAFSP